MTFIDWMFAHPYLATIIILTAIVYAENAVGNILRSIIYGFKKAVCKGDKP